MRIGDGDDLHHAGLEEALDPLADRRLGQSHRLGELGVGAAAVGLELADDLLVDLVDADGAGQSARFPAHRDEFRRQEGLIQGESSFWPLEWT